MCWSPTFRVDIVDGFRYFCQQLSWREGDSPPDSLLDYIGAWLFDDEGAQITCGSYEAYLQAILLIIDAYDKDPSIINFEGDGTGAPAEVRTVPRLLDLSDWGADFLDPHVYRKAVADLEF